MHHSNAHGMSGTAVLDPQGEKIGTVSDVYVDEQTGEPRWIIVDTGLLSAEVIVPFTDIQERGAAIVVPFAKRLVKNAPHMGMSDELDDDQERALNEHYGLHGRAA